MPSSVHAGTIFIEDRPLITRALDLDSQPYLGSWGILQTTNLESHIREAGWQFFFMATNLNARVLGSARPETVKRALKHIFSKVRHLDFNCLQVVSILEGRFLGVPYTTVSVHSRHIQQGCLLQSETQRSHAKQSMQIVA